VLKSIKESGCIGWWVD